MARCGGQTLSGGECRQFVKEEGTRCWQHSGPQCSICFTCMNTVNTRTLGCGHEFHTRCIQKWKTNCRGPDPTCPMCRTPFDVPTYRCRLIIERTSDSFRHVNDFETSNIASILDGFGLEFREIVPSQGRFLTDVRFDIDPEEVLNDILRELNLPVPTENVFE